MRRDLARKQLVAEQIRQIEKARLEQLKETPKTGPNLMVLVLMRVIGIGQAPAPRARNPRWRAHHHHQPQPPQVIPKAHMG
jgi:hypothetical protein